MSAHNRHTRIVFMGSPEFAVPTLRSLADEGYDVAAVVTQPDRPAGRGARITPPPVKIVGQDLGLEIVQPESLREAGIQQQLASLQPDLLVVAAYGQILPRAVLQIPRLGSLNVHASLLPRWRGASPIAAAVLAGDQTTGVSIMELVSKMDAGPVVSQAETSIGERETAGELERRLSLLGASTLLAVLPQWMAGEVSPVPQDESAATYCGRISKADGFLRTDWSVGQAERAVRAYNPWPGASVGYRDSRLAIWDAHIDRSLRAATGALLVRHDKPAVAMEGGLLVLDEVQRSGARRMTGREFLNGESQRLASRVELV